MSQQAKTKDEIFLLKLYELANRAGSLSTAIDCYEIGRAIGQNDRGAAVIARTLAQTNFIKKGEGDYVVLTSQGIRFAQEHA